MAKTIDPFKNIPTEAGQEPAAPTQDPSKLETLQVGFGGRVLRVDRNGIWLGAEKFADAPFSVDMDGNIVATTLNLSGYLEIGEALADIGAGNITGTYIANGAIITSKIAANAVTADKISVNELSAISADIGSVTSGTITGALIRTSSSGSRVEIDDSTDSIEIYDSSGDLRLEIYDNLINFNDPSEIRVASIYASASSNLLIDASNQAGSNVLINAGTSGSVIIATGSNNYMEFGAGDIEVYTFMDFNGYWIHSITSIDFDDVSSNPNSNGMMVYYDNGVTEGLRMQFGGSDFQFDASGV